MSSGWDRLALLWLLQNASGLDQIKSHLRRSVREFVLAACASLNLLHKEIDPGSRPDFPHPAVETVFAKAGTALKLILDFLPSDKPAVGAPIPPEWRDRLLEAVIAIIDEELKPLDPRSGLEVRTRIQALTAIRRAFLSRMGREEEDPAETAEEPRQAKRG